MGRLTSRQNWTKRMPKNRCVNYKVCSFEKGILIVSEWREKFHFISAFCSVFLSVLYKYLARSFANKRASLSCQTNFIVNSWQKMQWKESKREIPKQYLKNCHCSTRFAPLCVESVAAILLYSQWRTLRRHELTGTLHTFDSLEPVCHLAGRRRTSRQEKIENSRRRANWEETKKAEANKKEIKKIQHLMNQWFSIGF